MTDRYLPLGEAVDDAYATAVEDWLRMYRRGQPTEVAMTSTLQRVVLDVQLRPGRMGFVLVSLHSRGQIPPEVHYQPIYPTPYSALRAISTD